jgi:hypothetical protein
MVGLQILVLRIVVRVHVPQPPPLRLATPVPLTPVPLTPVPLTPVPLTPVPLTFVPPHPGGWFEASRGL